MFFVRFLLICVLSAGLLGVIVVVGSPMDCMTPTTRAPAMELKEVMDTCNSSFLIPMGPYTGDATLEVCNKQKHYFHLQCHKSGMVGSLTVLEQWTEYINEFNSTGALPDETDKTGMCYIRCVFEKLGLIMDWKLNKPLLQQTMWPATGDSVEVCEQEGKSESNTCTRIYLIAKCLMIRALVDARDKQ